MEYAGACHVLISGYPHLSHARCVPRLTLSVAGIFKELLTFVLAWLLLPGNELSVINGVGLAVSLVGISYYNLLKYRSVCTL